MAKGLREIVVAKGLGVKLAVKVLLVIVGVTGLEPAGLKGTGGKEGDKDL